jgi:EAL domain-containing protein (putative c-di-GMP-specific phosphodiesterase class I)
MFEITETEGLIAVSRKELMETIKQLGRSFTLDDFGLLPSFYYIRQLPIDIVGIDGSFIRTWASPDDQILVKVVRSGQRFGKRQRLSSWKARLPYRYWNP